jgi:hypothetical protein
MPAPWNPRTIRDERFKNLCASIEADPEFLWRRPILAMADGTIYAGNMRYRAASHLGLATVPAIVEDVGETLAKERALRDNAQWGDWQDDQLAEMVYQMAADGSDVKLLGIEPGDLAKMLGEVGVGEGADGGDQFHYEEKYAVTVMCADAADQERVFNELKERGYECRVVVV